MMESKDGTTHTIIQPTRAHRPFVYPAWPTSTPGPEATWCKLKRGDWECGILRSMRPPIFVRSLSQDEREQIEAGLRSSDAFVLRRCQILLASARSNEGQPMPPSATTCRCALWMVVR
ncbi:MAG TPA: hypothetical protein VFA09_13820 [Ktedonobacteraceae bacterium]|nr:hypothetical protein [Ktedonobacteraceae bacterium]